RLRALATAGAIFSGTSFAVLAAGSWLDGSAAVVVLCGVIVAFSIGECIHGAVNNPLIADLAPPALLGRYMALRTTSWQVGFLARPARRADRLPRSPAAPLGGAAPPGAPPA